MKISKGIKLFAFMMMIMALCMSDVTSFAAGTVDHGSRTAINNETELNDAVKAGGNYYLAADIAAGTLTIPSGKVFDLCLHGHDINHYGWGSAIVVSEGAAFNLSDESDTGCIRGGDGTGGDGFQYDGAGILNKGTFNMTGGVITENYTYSRYGAGGGVYNIGIFNMSGGVIRDNEAGDCGGGVCNKGTFNMTGGKITGNSATDYNAARGYGGGVGNEVPGIFNMSGGEITGNSGRNYTGGVSGKIGISGSPVIADNTAAGKPWDCDGGDLIFKGPLTDGARIGIHLWEEAERGQDKVFAEGWDKVYGDPADHFFSDHKGSEVKLDSSDDTKLALHFHGGGRVEGREATCTGTGLKAYYKCTCGRIYEDNEGTREITGDLDEWRVAPPKGHDWTDFTYDWSEDHSECTANGVCSRDSAHKISKKGTVTSEICFEATCTTPAKMIFKADFDDPAIPSDERRDWVGEPLGHDWKPAEYSWSGDRCFAERVCRRKSYHSELCVAAVTSSRTKAPECTEPGELTYTAEFDKSWAQTQTRTVKDGEPTGHDWQETGYIWSLDGSECTAFRVCRNDADHVESSHASVTSQQTKDPTCTAKGETTYTADFDVQWAQTQKKTIMDIEATGHSFGEQWQYDETEHWHECECGERTDTGKHEYGDWKVTKEPTRKTAGEKERMCACGHTETAEVAVLPPYEVADGSGQSSVRGSGDEIGFTINGDPDSLTGIEVDGRPLGDGDFIIDGDRVILKQAYLDSLGAGEHEIVFIYEDGQCSASFIIKDSAAAGGPETGDPHADMIFYALAAIGAASAAACMIFTVRRRSER